ncbi:hypothetical protein PSN_4097 [Pseudomonas sp. NGC7]
MPDASEDVHNWSITGHFNAWLLRRWPWLWNHLPQFIHFSGT